MTERDFFYWLQGFFELSGATELTEEQIKVVRDHMRLVEDERQKRQSGTVDFTEPSRWTWGIEPTTTVIC